MAGSHKTSETEIAVLVKLRESDRKVVWERSIKHNEINGATWIAGVFCVSTEVVVLSVSLKTTTSGVDRTSFLVMQLPADSPSGVDSVFGIGGEHADDELHRVDYFVEGTGIITYYSPSNNRFFVSKVIFGSAMIAWAKRVDNSGDSKLGGSRGFGYNRETDYVYAYSNMEDSSMFLCKIAGDSGLVSICVSMSGETGEQYFDCIVCSLT